VGLDGFDEGRDLHEVGAGADYGDDFHGLEVCFDFSNVI
jgi:hypothetical protein